MFEEFEMRTLDLASHKGRRASGVRFLMGRFAAAWAAFEIPVSRYPNYTGVTPGQSLGRPGEVKSP